MRISIIAADINNLFIFHSRILHTPNYSVKKLLSTMYDK